VIRSMLLAEQCR